MEERLQAAIARDKGGAPEAWQLGERRENQEELVGEKDTPLMYDFI